MPAKMPQQAHPPSDFNPLLDDAPTQPEASTPRPEQQSTLAPHPISQELSRETAEPADEDHVRRQELEHKADEARRRGSSRSSFGSDNLGCTILGAIGVMGYQIYLFARMPADASQAAVNWRVGGFIGSMVGLVGYIAYQVWRRNR